MTDLPRCITPEHVRALEAAGLAIVPMMQTRRQEGARIMAMCPATPRTAAEAAAQYAAQVEAGRVRA